MPTTRNRRRLGIDASPLEKLKTPQHRAKRSRKPSQKQKESDEYQGSTKKKQKRATQERNTKKTLMQSPASGYNSVKPSVPLIPPLPGLGICDGVVHDSSLSSEELSEVESTTARAGGDLPESGGTVHDTSIPDNKDKLSEVESKTGKPDGDLPESGGLARDTSVVGDEDSGTKLSREELSEVKSTTARAGGDLPESGGTVHDTSIPDDKDKLSEVESKTGKPDGDLPESGGSARDTSVVGDEDSGTKLSREELSEVKSTTARAGGDLPESGGTVHDTSIPDNKDKLSEVESKTGKPDGDLPESGGSARDTSVVGDEDSGTKLSREELSEVKSTTARAGGDLPESGGTVHDTSIPDDKDKLSEVESKTGKPDGDLPESGGSARDTSVVGDEDSGTKLSREELSEVKSTTARAGGDLPESGGTVHDTSIPDDKDKLSEVESKTGKPDGDLPESGGSARDTSVVGDEDSGTKLSREELSEVKSTTARAGGDLPESGGAVLDTSVISEDEFGVDVSEDYSSVNSSDGREGNRKKETNSLSSRSVDESLDDLLFDSDDYDGNSDDRKKKLHADKLSREQICKRLSFSDGNGESKPRRKGSIYIPDDLISFQGQDIAEIDLKLKAKHDCFCRFRKTGKECRFPFTFTTIFSLTIDMAYLQKPVEECESPRDLYGNYAILDTATQWMFHRDIGKQQEKFDLHLPACVYGILNRKGNNFEQVIKMCETVRGWTDFFDFQVVPLIVWHGQHFSIAYIVNAGMLFKKKQTMSGVPCILYSNSLTSGGAHHKEKVSVTIRNFLNNVAGSRTFSKKNLKAYDIVTCSQSDSYSCAYHTILSRDAVLKEIQRRTITETDISNNFKYRNFSYNEDDVLKVRAGICELVSAISVIKNVQPSLHPPMISEIGDTESMDEPFLRPRAKAKKEDIRNRREENRKKKAINKESRKQEREKAIIEESRKQELEKSWRENSRPNPKEIVKKMKEKRSKDLARKLKSREEKERSDRWTSRIGNEVSEEEKQRRLEDLRRISQRKVGEPCSAVSRCHDRAFRRACYNAVTATSMLASTCRYITEPDTQYLPRPKSFLMIHDPVVEDPTVKDCGTVRKNPLRIVVGVSKTEFMALLTECLTNIDSIIFSDDEEEIDKMLLGTDRVGLKQFIQKSKKKDAEEERIDDQQARGAAREDIIKSVRKNKLRSEAIRKCDGF